MATIFLHDAVIHWRAVDSEGGCEIVCTFLHIVIPLNGSPLAVGAMDVCSQYGCVQPMCSTCGSELEGAKGDRGHDRHLAQVQAD